MTYHIRDYARHDKDSLLRIIVQHIPQFFHTRERSDFSNYLDQNVEDYFVVTSNNHILGGGGINYFSEFNSARISWDMIDANYPGQGIGRQLLMYRIERVRQFDWINTLFVRTSQFVYRFYAKHGFRTIRIEENFWAFGYHLYEMKLTMK